MADEQTEKPQDNHVDAPMEEAEKPAEKAPEPEAKASPAADATAPVADPVKTEPAAKEGDAPVTSPKAPPVTTRQYLESSVVPILMQAMQKVAKERPEDPVKFVADYLHEHNPAKKARSS